MAYDERVGAANSPMPSAGAQLILAGLEVIHDV
jgi:hypothetical protein